MTIALGITIACAVYSSLMLGAGWNTLSYLSNVNAGYCVNGNTHPLTDLTALWTAGMPGKPNFTWKDAGRMSLEEAKNQVESGYYHFMIYFPENWTITWESFFVPNTVVGMASYQNPVYFIYDEGNQQSLVNSIKLFVYPLTSVTNQYLGDIAFGINPNISFSQMQDVNSFTNAYQLVDTNLHPVGSVGLSLVSTFYLYILFIFCQFVAMSLKATSFEMVRATMESYNAVAMYGFFNVFESLLIAVCPTLLVFAFLQGDTGPIHNGLLLFYLTIAFFLNACIAFVRLLLCLPEGLNMAVVAIFGILMMVSADIQTPLALEHVFFHVGYITPIYHASHALKWIIFNSNSSLGLSINYGVLALYGGVSHFTFHFLVWKGWVKPDINSDKAPKTITIDHLKENPWVHAAHSPNYDNLSIELAQSSN